MQIGFRWLDEGESQNFIDLFDEEIFVDGASQLPIEHDVLKPNGRHYARARCHLTVRRTKILLDYSAFPVHNKANGILLGITTFTYDKTASTPIFDVTWHDLEEPVAYENSVEFLTRPTKYRKLDDEQKTFTELVEHAGKLRNAQLKQFLPPLGVTPPERTVTTTSYVRNPYVVAYALRRAKGMCEMCGRAAPFVTRALGEPYLEVHHLIPLSKGGADDIENTRAVCPNCHREAHYGEA